MRLGIAAKLSLPAVLLVVVATTLTAWLLYANARATLTDHELVDLRDETALRGRELLGSLDQLRADMLYLAGASATRAVLVAHVQSGETGSALTPAERTASMSITFLRSAT